MARKFPVIFHDLATAYELQNFSSSIKTGLMQMTCFSLTPGKASFQCHAVAEPSGKLGQRIDQIKTFFLERAVVLDIPILTFNGKNGCQFIGHIKRSASLNGLYFRKICHSIQTLLVQLQYPHFANQWLLDNNFKKFIFTGGMYMVLTWRVVLLGLAKSNK